MNRRRIGRQRIGRRNRSITKGIVNLCWFLFKWSFALVIVAALVGVPFFYRDLLHRVDDELRERVQAKLGERFPHLEVRIRAAQLVGDGIEVRGLSIIEPGAAGPQAELMCAEEVFLACDTSLQELVAGEPHVTSIKVTRPIVRATRRPDGSFSLGKLLPDQGSKQLATSATVENGTIQVFDPLKNPSTTFTLRDISLTVRGKAEDGKAAELAIEGSLAADQIQHIELVGVLDPHGEHWTLSGTVDGLEISPELRHSLPEPFAEPLERVASLRARADLTFRVSGGEAQPQLKFEVNGRLGRGRIDDPLLPYPLTDLRADFHCDNAGLRVRNLSTHHGEATLDVPQLDCGFDARSPLFARISGKKLRLSRELGSALPDKNWRTDWNNYAPEGDVDLECTVRFDGRQWHPTAKVTCLNNVSFSCHRFPYRLEGGRGTLSLEGNVAQVHMVAFSGAQPVTLDGQFLNPGPNYSGKMEVRAEKIHFDEKLFAAILKPRARETIRSINPRGTFDCRAVFWRDPNDPLPRPDIHQWAQITLHQLNRCSMNYDKFPYPLYNVQGTIVMQDGQWDFPKLVGTNGTGVVTCAGKLTTSPAADRLALGIRAQAVPLENGLRNALHPDQQQLWNSLQPRGIIDLNAEVGYDSRTQKMDVDLHAFPYSRDDATSVSTSIEPVAFPYRMEKLSGAIHYHDGHVALEKMQAIHRNTVIHTGGHCDFLPDGGWRLHLEKLDVDRLRLQGEDHDLHMALPEELKRAVTELKPTGPINLKGNFEFGKRTASSPLETGWDMDLHFFQGSLQVGPKLENIFGSVHLTGNSDGTRHTSRGELKFESLTYKNLQFTDVMGPLHCDNGHVYLGDPEMRQNAESRRLTAKIFDGVIAADCRVRLGAVPQYELVATVSQADLGRFARENLPNHPKLKGKVLANVGLRGSRGSHTLFGAGNIRLSDAEVYELPVMAALLKIVRAKTPDTTAFTQSDINFSIRGEHLIFDQLAFRGDAISLSGNGWMKLDGQTNPVNLDLHTTVGRGNVPMVTEALTRASRQILKIQVTGSLDHPIVEKTAFPAATQAIQQLQADYDKPAASPHGGFMRAIGISR